MDELKRNASGYADPTAYEALTKVQKEGTIKARDYLEQLKTIDKTIENKLREKEQWRSMALSTTTQLGGERVQSSHNPQKMSDAIVKYIELEDEINECVDRLVDLRKEIISLLDAIDNPLDYAVLHKHYVQYKSFGKIAAEENYSYQYIIEVHGRGLKKVQKILNNL